MFIQHLITGRRQAGDNREVADKLSQENKPRAENKDNKCLTFFCGIDRHMRLYQ